MEYAKLGSRRATRNKRGIALILVLMLVVLTTIVLLAFFLSVQTESKSVRSVISGQNSRQLADIAVQSVIAQIQKATTQGNTIAWASQPGMIRTYNSNGKAVGWYKLYSSGSSTLNNPSEAIGTITGDLPTGTSWTSPTSNNYGVFTDLNSPVISADGNLTYPVINPNGATSIATTAGTNPIRGFDIDTTTTPGYSSSTPVGPANNQAAMPVRWIYVLQDGTQVPAGSGTSGTVTVAGASHSNPIVGRIAYWTDDETCKLNVNTAGDGTYYDTPRFNGASAVQYNSTETGAQRDIERLNDKQFAVSPPLGAEYQRYIGHPAQTKLSYAFPFPTPAASVAQLDLGSISQVFSNISPFMQWGGSEAGAYTTLDAVPPLFPPQRQTPYASLDEWMFNTQLNSSNNRMLNVDLNGTPIVNNMAQPTSTQPNPSLQQLRFFLSANSEAPEVNLMGQPRIAIWPVSSDYNMVSNPNSPYVTTADKLIANAASLVPTTGGVSTQVPYYFSRLNTGTSPTLPGSQSARNDYQLLTRNQNIFAFLRALSNTAIPGYGPATQPTFYLKYGFPEMDQVLTEIFDYIRSTNPCDPQLYGGGAGSTTDYRYSKQSLRTVKVYGGTDYVGVGQVVPTIITGLGNYTTKGFGRFYSINEVTINFTQTAFSYLPPAPCTIDPTHEILTAMVHVGLYSPSLGPPAIVPDMRIEISGLNNLTVKTAPASATATQSLFGPVNAANYSPARTTYSVIPEPTDNSNASYNWHDDPPRYNFQWGGSTGPRQTTLFHTVPYADMLASGPGTGTATGVLTPAPTAQSGGYMFAGIPIKVPVNSIMTCSGATLTIKIGFANLSTTGSGTAGSKDPAFNTTNGEGYPGANSDTVQTFVVTIPSFTAPVPTLQAQKIKYTDPSTGAVSYIQNTVPSFQNRIFNTNYGPGNTDNSPITVITDTDYISNPSGVTASHSDVNRSLIAGYNGDARLIAAQTGTLTGEANPVTSDFATQPFVFLDPGSAANTTTMYHTQHDIFPNNNFRLRGCIAAPSSIPTGLSLLDPANVTYGCPPINGWVGDHTSSSSPDVNGDWDNGIGAVPDGPYINRPDENSGQYQTYGSSNASVASYLGNPPYYSGGSAGIDATAVGYSSPNRSLASPVTFGSLPTGIPMFNSAGSQIAPPVPWRTLLFRPQPTHFGATAPKDELLLDWFWMPVVNPYAISTTFATAGKVNMNYQIAPFTYITRATALMGVLASEYVIAIPTTAGTSYKTTASAPTTPYRLPIRLLAGNGISVTANIDSTTGTLGQFIQRFTSGQIFKSAAEICDINLVPNPTPTAASGPFNPTSASAAATYWSNNLLTGDNSRERPYNGLYSRLTTKSNTYTVHVRAQTLTSPSTLADGTWVENPALVASEYRGSVTINRYLDPQDSKIPDFVGNAASSLSLSDSLDNYYKYRVLETRRFLP